MGKEVDLAKREIERLLKEQGRKKIALEKSAADIQHAQTAAGDCRNQLESGKSALTALREKLNQIDTALAQSRSELQRREAVLVALDMKVRELVESRNTLDKLAESQRGELRGLETAWAAVKAEIGENENLIGVLQSENPFVEEDRDKFGVAGGEYDFEAMNIKELSDQSGKLQKEAERLKKLININVDEVGDTIERQYETLVQRKEIVVKDKRRLERIMKLLDATKRDALLKVWAKVNIDFGDIFKTLLPHARSRLELISKDDIMEGIEFKVSFNGIDKESLGELSGGQRTLIALSFIFALLKYNPAPLYILDEIDAALDISHTQNIGIMIKEKFPQSQFLVVSLKDGMFNNANVLFKVAFVDGSSRVTRIALRETVEDKEDGGKVKIMTKAKQKK